MGVAKDLSGQKFGAWTVIRRVENKVTRSGDPITAWLCRCDCGTERAVSGPSLVSGQSRSCGCETNGHRQLYGTAKRQDLTGQKFNRLTALRISSGVGTGVIYWECQCECGNIVNVRAGNLRTGMVKSCGCLRDEQNVQSNLKDLTGARFGRLLVLGLGSRRAGKAGKMRRHYLCMCECGEIVEVVRDSLIRGLTTSCGCLFQEMMQGRTNPNYNPQLTDTKRAHNRNDPRNRTYVSTVMARDNYTCDACGDNRGGNLVAHHLNSYADYPELRYEIDNGVTLCVPCHVAFHKAYGFGRNHREQYLEWKSQVHKQ